MEFTEEKLYQQIKEKNPNLNHFDIIRIQQKIITRLFERKKNHNINSKFHNEQNLRNMPYRNQNNNYIPRIEQPQFQEKIHRNQLEDSYQDFYKQRNEYNQQEYVNNIKKSGSNYQDSIFQNNELKQKNLMSQYIYENNLERGRNNIEKNDLILDNNNLDEQLRIFNLSSTYSIDELKNSYKKLALQHHPDRGGNLQNFRIITHAFNLSLIHI